MHSKRNSPRWGYGGIIGVAVMIAGCPVDRPMGPTTGEKGGMAAVAYFTIDLYEYPNVAGQMPKTDVTWFEAQALCAAEGKRLPTAQEWQMACEGPEGLVFPYGNAFIPALCTPFDAEKQSNVNTVTVEPSGTYPLCRSPYGAFDMVGNAWEWTATEGPERESRVVMGGPLIGPGFPVRCTSRAFRSPMLASENMGFRCVKSASDQ